MGFPGRAARESLFSVRPGQRVVLSDERVFVPWGKSFSVSEVTLGRYRVVVPGLRPKSSEVGPGAVTVAPSGGLVRWTVAPGAFATVQPGWDLLALGQATGDPEGGIPALLQGQWSVVGVAVDASWIDCISISALPPSSQTVLTVASATLWVAAPAKLGVGDRLELVGGYREVAFVGVESIDFLDTRPVPIGTFPTVPGADAFKAAAGLAFAVVSDGPITLLVGESRHLVEPGLGGPAFFAASVPAAFVQIQALPWASAAGRFVVLE